MERRVFLSHATDVAASLLRVVSGFMFMQAGGMKIFGWFGGMPDGQPAPLLSQAGIGGVLEFFGGVAMIPGLFTRPVAFILSGEMAVAYWQFHAPNGIWPTVNGGIPSALFCFVLLFFAAYGAPRWSVDALIKNRRAVDV